MGAEHEFVLFQVDLGGSAPPEPLTYDQPVSDLPIVDDARWSADVTGHSWGALAVWILLLIVIQAVAWPVVRRVFHRFPDRGWAFARMTSLLASGYVVWLLASTGLAEFRAIWCVVSMLAIGVIAWTSGRRQGPSAPWFRSPAIATVELVFWATFGLFLLFRLMNPDSYHPIWGGEKPMEFAHLNAVLRSPSFPPVDPWYSGGFINYYYYGTYLVAFMLKLTGIPAEIGFNLAQPTFIALIASGAFSISTAISRRFFRSIHLALLGGLIGTILVSFSGNLIAASRLVDRLRGGELVGSPYEYYVWNPSRAIPLTITEFPYFTGLYADLHAHVVAFPVTLILIAISYALILDGRRLALALLRPRRHPSALRWALLTFGLMTLTTGTLFPTNAWDVPTYAALSAISVLTATRCIRPFATRLAVTAGIVVAVGALSYTMVLPFYQHYVALYSSVQRVRSQTSVLELQSHLGVFLLVILIGLGSIMLSRIRRTSFLLDPLLAVALLGTVLLLRWYAVGRDPSLISLMSVLSVVVVVGLLVGIGLTVAVTSSKSGPLHTGQLAVLPLAAIATSIAIFTDRAAMGLALGIAGVAIWVWLSFGDPTVRFIALMITGSMSVVAGLELVFLADNLVDGPNYRMNSVFKFYNGAWVLLALASAGLASWMLAKVLERAPAGSRASGTPSNDPVGMSGSWARVGTVLAAVSIAASLVYPVTSTGPRLDQRFVDEQRIWSLNAYTWMDSGAIPETSISGGQMVFDEDRQIIDWFNRHVPGTPVIAEAYTGMYRCNGSRISIGTGLPAVMGWTNHESQQRYSTGFSQRVRDLQELYTSTDASAKIEVIEQYDIRYIVVGQIERNYPDGNPCEFLNNAVGIAGFDPLLGAQLEVAFQAGQSVVYRVIE